MRANSCCLPLSDCFVIYKLQRSSTSSLGCQFSGLSDGKACQNRFTFSDVFLSEKGMSGLFLTKRIDTIKPNMGKQVLHGAKSIVKSDEGLVFSCKLPVIPYINKYVQCLQMLYEKSAESSQEVHYRNTFEASIAALPYDRQVGNGHTQVKTTTARKGTEKQQWILLTLWQANRLFKLLTASSPLR